MNILEEFSQEYEILKEDVDRGVRTYKIRGVMGRANYPNKNRRVYPIDVMRESVNSVQEAIRGNRFLGELDHPCLLDKNFDVLAENGWEKFENLKEGDMVATFDENNNIEYQPIERIIDEPFKGKAYKFKGRNIDSSFTGAHRFYLENRYGKREIVTAREIYNNRTKYNKHKIIKIGNWEGESPETFTIPGILEEEYNGRFKKDVREPLVVETKYFVQLMGIWLAEGCTVNWKSDYSVNIYQNEGSTAEEIREMLNNLGLEYSEYKKVRENSISITFNIVDIRLWRYLEKLGNCYNKYIPVELKKLDSVLLEEMLEWFIKGDGRGHRGMYGGNAVNVFSVSKKLIEDLHEIVIKIGGSGNWTETNTTEDYMFADHLIEAKNKSTLYQLNISTTKGIYLDERFLKIEEIDHDGNIYCLTVPNGNFYMKQNNKAFLTGNSSIKINMDKISHKIVSLSMTEEGVVLGEMVPAGPYKDKLISLIEDGIGFGVSTRGTGALRPYRGPLGEGLEEVSNGYLLRAIDIVHDPSANAFPTVIKEETKDYFTVPTNFKKIWNEVFNIK